MKAIAVILLSLVTASAAEPKLLGFADASAERAAEARFDGFLKSENLRENMRRLTAHPHHVGSTWGGDNAQFIAAAFKAAGFETRIEEFKVLFPTPKTRLVELVAPTKQTLKLAEPPIEGDDTSNQQTEQLPTYNAYSADGDVTGDLVYVNYGIPKDYEELERRGIDLKGKIAIARYGGSWRGIKPKVAAEHGAIGCIIYSDPRGDGYYNGDVYPKGAFRNENGVQRGSVADMPIYPGDPLTPGVGATESAKRIDRASAQTIMKIPVLPISYGDARPLLEALGGPVAPDAWRGALPITYHLGAGPARVHMKLEFNWDLVPCRDVIGVLRGSELPDEWVVRGNHHDGWVNGAEDPISGQVAMMEEARALGELVKTGWKPRRTIVYCAWDGEEPGLLGSTEWVEEHMAELTAKAVAYINSDSNGRGFLYADGSHQLERLVNEVAADVPDPQTSLTVGERLRAANLVNANDKERDRLRGAPAVELGALGSGSDYTPFLQHAGVSSINIGFGGENDSGSYHSIYDSFALYTRFNDPDFAYGVALAKVGGRTVMRLADADTLPVECAALTRQVGKYADEVKELLDTTRKETDEQNRMIADGTLKAAADPKIPFVVPAQKGAVPHLNFAPLENAVDKLTSSGKALDKALAAGVPAAKRAEVNRILANIDRSFMRDTGLPGRPWFRHFVYAPGKYTGYGVKTLPGVREAIEQRNWSEANDQIVALAGVLEHCATELDRAAAVAR